MKLNRRTIWAAAAAIVLPAFGPLHVCAYDQAYADPYSCDIAYDEYGNAYDPISGLYYDDLYLTDDSYAVSDPYADGAEETDLPSDDTGLYGWQPAAEPELNTTSGVQLAATSYPDFSNSFAWSSSTNQYQTPELTGQCTWFTCGRFMEMYGWNPGIVGDGWENAYEVVNANPGYFYLSDTPAAGSVFSSDYDHNHSGIVLSVSEDGSSMVIQEGNIDGVSNSYGEAINDYWTRTVSLDELRSLYGDVVFANPIDQ